MSKNRLQEKAQKSRLKFPSYLHTREGPDHAPEFKATVKFNGKIYKSPTFYPTLRLAENAAAEEALNKGQKGGHKAAVPVSSKNRSAYMFKNRLQEEAQKSRLNFPSYSSTREGLDHAPQFKATVNFNGKTYKSPTSYPTLRQAENAAAEVALNTIGKGGQAENAAAEVALNTVGKGGQAENAAAEVALNTVEKRGHNLALVAVLAVLFLFLHAWLYPQSTGEPRNGSKPPFRLSRVLQE